MNDVAKVDPFEGALTVLRHKLPAEFSLRIPERYFRDVESMSVAQFRSLTMNAFERKARELGYAINKYQDLSERDCPWWYDLKRTHPPSRPPAAIELSVKEPDHG
jgi:hypothetical protein